MALVKWFLKKVVLSIWVSFTGGFLGWFFLNVVAQQTDWDILDFTGRMYLPILVILCAYDVLRSLAISSAIAFVALRLGLRYKVVKDAVRFGLPKERPVTEWTADWVIHEVSQKRALEEISEALMRAMK